MQQYSHDGMVNRIMSERDMFNINTKIRSHGEQSQITRFMDEDDINIVPFLQNEIHGERQSSSNFYELNNNITAPNEHSNGEFYSLQRSIDQSVIPNIPKRYPEQHTTRIFPESNNNEKHVSSHQISSMIETDFSSICNNFNFIFLEQFSKNIKKKKSIVTSPFSIMYLLCCMFHPEVGPKLI